ncbi:MAG: hypothetical protein ACFFDE_03315 [Promethearchaeota archaeon]
MVPKESTNIILKPINIWRPIIGHTLISSKAVLHEIVDQEYFGLRRIQNYSKLICDAESHVELFNRLRNRTFLNYGELRQFARKYNLSRNKIQGYIKDGSKPRLYFLIEKGFSKTEGKKRFEKLRVSINYLNSTQKVLRALKTYFPFEELLGLWGRKKFFHLLNQVNKYFQVLNKLSEGGSYSQIAKDVQMRESQIWNWINKGIRPDLVNLASKIPKRVLKPRSKWLPIRMRNGYPYYPVGFTEVPLKPRKWAQIREVIDSLKTEHNMELETFFEDIEKNEAFAYVLGIMTSDAAKNGRGTSMRLDLRLSKSYDWSKEIGDYTCNCLKKLGISANEHEPEKKRSYHHWISEKSPIITWMLRCCLGIKRNEVTTYNQIRAEWLLKAPHEIKVKFLQGLSDGDGWASVSNHAIGITCGVNKSFVSKLLLSCKIRAFEAGRNIQIKKPDSVEQAVNLPFFLNASGRQKAAKKVGKMARARQSRGNAEMPSEIYERILELRKKSNSYGRIAEAIFDETGYSYSSAGIFYILKRA